MKEFVKTKKGKITIGVIVLLILMAVILGVVLSGASEKDGQKQPNHIDVDQKDNNEDADNEQEGSVNTGDGLKVSDSLEDSKDTISASGEKEETDQDEVSAGNENSDSGDGPQDSEDSEDGTEGSEGGTEVETFGELY